MAARPAAAQSATVVHLPIAPAAVPGPIDLASLNQWELQVIFYAAGLRWRTHWKTRFEDLAAIVVEQVNRIGLDAVREVARQIELAIDTCQWQTWETLLPGREARHDSDSFADMFRRRMVIASHEPSAAVAAWQQAITARDSDEQDREVA